jgi:signal peptidase I
MPLRVINPTGPETKAGPIAKAAEARPEPPRDTMREVFETVVFVVVLVLMLKLFVAEAFVIPTGSMAPTLLGDHVSCTCRECGHRFPINASSNSPPVDTYTCENCGFVCPRGETGKDVSTSPSSGDRVLVSKYEYHLFDPRRFEVPVFKYPQKPYSKEERAGMNYIKRLVGLGGETVAVFGGDLYVTQGLNYEHVPQSARPPRQLDAWKPQFMYPNDDQAVQAFRQGTFDIVRKTPSEIMAMRRLVFDLDKQAQSLTGVYKTRWQPDEEQGGGWSVVANDREKGFQHSGNDESWLLYQHINAWAPPNNQPPFQQKKIDPERSRDPRFYIVDFIGYNVVPDPTDPNAVSMFAQSPPWDRWVSDLALDCTVDLPSADSEVSLELAKGHDRFRAVFTKGECKLIRLTTTAAGTVQKEMGSHATSITKGGRYALRLANFDGRLTVWVDDAIVPFGTDQTDYLPWAPTTNIEPFPENDLLRPARIGVRGDVKATRVSLWRDLQYRCSRPDLPNLDHNGGDMRRKAEELRQETLEGWGGHIPACGSVQTYYVQPGHYLMFGDNVNSSADSRSWGQVPNRLMLGRAIVVYWPPSRIGVIK